MSDMCTSQNDTPVMVSVCRDLLNGSLGINATCLAAIEVRWLYRDLRSAILVLYMLTFVIGFTGNALVICIICRFRWLARCASEMSTRRQHGMSPIPAAALAPPLAAGAAAAGAGAGADGPSPVDLDLLAGQAPPAAGYKRVKRSVADYFLLNLAVADLSYVIFLPLFCWATYADQWPFHGLLADASCKMAYVARDVTKYASIFTLVGVSVMQCMASGLNSPNFCEQQRTLTRGKCACFVIWIICGATSTHYFLFVRTLSRKGPVSERLSCLIDLPHSEAGRTYFYFWTMSQFIVGLVVPSCAIFTMYGVLYRKLKTRPHLSHFTSALTKTVFVVALLFTLCNLPYHALQLINLHSTPGGAGGWCPKYKDAILAASLNAGAQILLFVPSCCNPIIYGLLSDRYRDLYWAFFTNTMRCMGCTRVTSSACCPDVAAAGGAAAGEQDNRKSSLGQPTMGQSWETGCFKLRLVVEYHPPCPSCRICWKKRKGRSHRGRHGRAAYKMVDIDGVGPSRDRDTLEGTSFETTAVDTVSDD